MPDARVPRQRLRVVEAPARISLDQGALHPPVLVAERDLEMEDLLAVTLEAEVAGLDPARVDRAHRHLVHLLSLHAVVVHDADRRAGSVPTREAHRLQPRM